jgi:hypothetical protein
MTELLVDWKPHLLVEYSKNRFSCELMDGELQDDRYKVVNDIIYYKGRIYLVPGSTFRGKLLQDFHDAPIEGHQGFLKTSRQVREMFSWKGLKGDVLCHIRECATC